MLRWVPRIFGFVAFFAAAIAYFSVPIPLLSDVGVAVNWAREVNQWVIVHAAYPGLLLLFVAIGAALMVPDLVRTIVWFLRRHETLAKLEVSGPNLLSDGEFIYQVHWRMKVHNSGPAAAANPQIKLKSGSPGSKDPAWKADYPYSIVRIGHTLDEPEYHINPGDDESFEIVLGWKNDGGQFFTTLSPRGNVRPILIEPGERWEFSYDITAKNASTISFTLRIFIEDDEIKVVRIS